MSDRLPVYGLYSRANITISTSQAGGRKGSVKHETVGIDHKADNFPDGPPAADRMGADGGSAGKGKW